MACRNASGRSGSSATGMTVAPGGIAPPATASDQAGDAGHESRRSPLPCRVATPPDWHPPPRWRRPSCHRAWATGWPSWCHRRPLSLVFGGHPAASLLAPMFSNGSSRLDFLGVVTPSLNDVRSTNFFFDHQLRTARSRLVDPHRIGKGIHAALQRSAGCIRETDQFWPSVGVARPWGWPAIDRQTNSRLPRAGRAKMSANVVVGKAESDTPSIGVLHGRRMIPRPG